MPLYSSKDSPDAQPLVRAHFLPSSSSGSVPCKPETKKKKSKKMTSLSDDTKITQRTCHPRAAATWPCHHLRPTSWPICCKKKVVCLCLLLFFFFLIHYPFLLISSHLLLLLHLLPSRILQIQDKVRRSWNQRNLSWETQQVRNGLHLQVFNQPPSQLAMSTCLVLLPFLQSLHVSSCYTVSGPRSWLWLTRFRKSQGNLLKPPFLAD